MLCLGLKHWATGFGSTDLVVTIDLAIYFFKYALPFQSYFPVNFWFAHTYFLRFYFTHFNTVER